MKSEISPADIEQYKTMLSRFDFKLMLDIAMEVLIANGITNVNILTFDQNLLLSSLIMMDQNIRFHMFVYGIESPFKSQPYSRRKEYSHSLALIIDNKTRSCYLVNSMASHCDTEKTHLETALSILPGYQVKVLRGTNSLETDIDSGQHTIANIISLIHGDINLETGEGLFQAGQERTDIAGIFTHAMATVNKKHAREEELVRTFHVKKALIIALGKLTVELIPHEVHSLRIALEEDIRLINREDDSWKQQMFPDFMRHFIEKNPENSVARIVGVNFYDELPTVGTIQTLVMNHLGNKFTGLLAQSIAGPSSSMDPLVSPACSSTRPKLSFFSPELPNYINEAKNIHALTKALIIAARTMSFAMKQNIQALYEALNEEVERDTELLRANPENKVKTLGVVLSDFFQANPDNLSSTLFTQESFASLQKELGNLPSLVEKQSKFVTWFSTRPELEIEESIEPGQSLC